MHPQRRRGRTAPTILGYLALCAALSFTGCASPGPPHAPSLHLPQPVRDLAVQRTGNTVELRFTAPRNSTDKLPLRGSALSGEFCRQLPHQPCLPASGRLSVPLANSSNSNNLVTWTDTLPPALTSGPPELLAYRVQFFNASNHSAGPSNQAFTASGQPPTPIANLRAQGSRQGIILQWTPTPGEVVLRRENLSPTLPGKSSKSPPPPPTIWLQTNDSKHQDGVTLDTTALPDTPYRYVAQLRTKLQFGDHSVELRSTLSSPITLTLTGVYPPPVPPSLTAAGYTSGSPSTFAVDLIWQPVSEANLVTPIAGYNLYRETLSAVGQSTSNRQRLNTLPILQPSFHDTTANPTATYRYSVTAVDAKGNESPASTTTLSPTP